MLLLANAGVAVASGLDRLAARGAGALALPLGPFAAQGHTLRAQVALQARDYGRAEAAARTAVAQAPVDPMNAGALGAALLAQGDLQAADKAFRAAGQMGWREPFTQAYWMRVAIATGDWDIAAQRADAVLRIDPSQTGNPQIVGPFEQAPAGRAALLVRMRESPGWLKSYFLLPPEAPLETLASRADLLVALGRERTVPCDTVAPFAAGLARAGPVARAHSAWIAHCKAGKRSLLNDASLAAAEPRPAVPFAWQLVPSGSLTLRRNADGIEVENSASFPRSFARQLLVLPAGEYRLSWLETKGTAEEARVVPTIGCAADRGARLDPEPIGGGRFAASFNAGTGCEGLWLTLLAQRGRTSLADLRLEPA